MGHAPRGRNAARRGGTRHGFAADSREARGPQHEDRRRVHGPCRRDGAVCIYRRSFTPSAPASSGSAGGARPDRKILGGVVEKMQAGRTLLGRRHPLAPDIEGADLLADRSHCCRAHDLTAGAVGRDAQLGLSLLLVARCDADAARPHGGRLRRGGAVLARMAVARRGRKSGPGSDHVRNRRRAATD